MLNQHDRATPHPCRHSDPHPFPYRRADLLRGRAGSTGSGRRRGGAPVPHLGHPTGARFRAGLRRPLRPLSITGRDSRQALADADSALEADPTNGATHALRGETLRLRGRPHSALEAFDQALTLDPALGPDTFRSRWLAARAAREGRRMLLLSGEYADSHPQDPLRHYYRGWAFIEMDNPGAAISTLIKKSRATPEPPAALWFALGQAYAANRSWPEAIISFEAVRVLVQAGDTSLIVHTDQPIAALFSALGQAYLGAGRCADAETMLEYAIQVGAPASEYAALLEEASLCQTPTPTITPYPTTTPSLQ